jgi:hypothetical protein
VALERPSHWHFSDDLGGEGGTHLDRFASSRGELDAGLRAMGRLGALMLTPGLFENGSASWALSGGARVVDGNEPFFLHQRTDRHSLYLPQGSSASSATMCFALGDWHLRLLMRNAGSATGSLRVSVIVPSLVGGLLTVLDGGTVKAGSAWAPSPRLALLLGNVTSLLGTRAVAFRFTPVGSGAAFQIDDVYLDPWKCT